MNKSIIYSLLIGLVLFVACDPVESRDEMTGAITAEQLNVTATPLVVDGVRSNKIILENHSPVLSHWDYGMGATSKAYDEVLVSAVGDMVVTFTGRNGDGTTITKELPINVEAIVFEVVGMDKFIGDGSKTWVWDEWTNERDFGGPGVYPYGIGGSVADKSPAWWGLLHGSFDESDATMTFALDGGAVFTKTLGDGTKQKGTFSFNMNKKIEDWSQGILTLKGATIPHPQSMNGGGGDATEFYILVLEDDQLVLSTVTGNEILEDVTPWSHEVNIWMFRPEGYTAFDVTEQMATLTGGSERTWTWTGSDGWGNNGVDANGPGWWIVKTPDIDGQAPGEGEGASMVFSNDGKMVKHKNTGESIEGTFSIGSPLSEKWGVGTLKTKDVTVLCGVAGNNQDQGYEDGRMPVYQYGIIELTDSKMVLGFNNPSGNEGWYWIFTPKE
ncbi:hypothetical protein M2459_001226 [Parabacteroides sp. PF5-5]|uniref:hypothetical protein n=1 Tax=unclassified Parabacteroides TaxID=2649774 RepID=UPI002476F172|nr:MULTISPECIES: hypothetical protein [unclassified Parabacteroides]MDH6304493.1 hypothetical protein [Parabacteroides sp. PH5-39]MDH6315354.1 hypothetical protein [Parabacteroides sp. PF5-13]MDH6319152.1 hypothetical protein [Parabacteroides sp. PH5-13]MDH6322882.1 hypothetical protein [Parabacteroides sp. PH5-8]MDH6326546.1 hypothetical protein [Parabacteroides sp. PH5-41]